MVFSPWDKHRFVVTSALNDDVGVVDGCGCYSISSGGVCVWARGALAKQQTVVNQQHVILKEIHFMSILSFCCCLSRYLCVCCLHRHSLSTIGKGCKNQQRILQHCMYILLYVVLTYRDLFACISRSRCCCSPFLLYLLQIEKCQAKNFNFATCINQTKATKKCSAQHNKQQHDSARSCVNRKELKKKNKKRKKSVSRKKILSK